MPESLTFFLVCGTMAALVAAVRWLLWEGMAQSARRADAYARAVDLALDPALAPTVARRLQRRERAGAVGTLVGGVAAAAAMAPLADDDTGAYQVLALVLGMMAGNACGQGLATWRETRRPGPAGPRVARVAVPAHGDYVAPHERVGAWVTAGIGVVVGVVFLLAPRPAALTGPLPVGLAVVAIVLPPLAVLLDELVARRLLDRPQVAASATELAWDDALRARALRDLVGVPLSTGFFAAASVLGVAGDGLTGGWPANPAVGVVSGSYLLLLMGGVVMAVVTEAARPRRHFRRRLWPTDDVAAARPAPGAPGAAAQVAS